MGPWYRIGLPLGNCLVLVAIVELIACLQSSSHFLAYEIAEYQYGLFGHPPGDFRKDFAEYPLWVLLAVIIVLQILADVILWIAVIVKGNKNFLVAWLIITISRHLYSAFIEIRKRWDWTYEISTALHQILAFLWGTIFFGFIACTGLQTLYFIVSEKRDKIPPIGEGFCGIKDFYKKHSGQLATVLLISEMIVNIHRSINYSTSPFLMEAKDYLMYAAPDEHGTTLSVCTLIINAVGLIAIALKKTSLQRCWLPLYTVTILLHLLVFVYISFDWLAVLEHPTLFDLYLVTCILHLIYKSIIIYVYCQCCCS